MRNRMLVAAALALAVTAAADPFARELKRANAMLRSGDADSALAAYRELQIERPEDPLLHYNIGCAQYEEGDQQLRGEANLQGIEILQEAAESFQKAASSGQQQVRRSAGFNRANSLAMVAKKAQPEKPEEKLEAFRTAIQTYEEFLRRHPDHEGARHNLDHMRYLLKKMLQNPPPPQEQSGENEDEPQDQQEQNQEQQQEQQDQQQPQQGEDQEQSQANQEQRQDENQDQQQAPAAAGQQAAEDEEQTAEPQDAPAAAGARANQAEPPPAPDRQTIEALLDSLDQMDRREQREVRRGPNASRLRNEWW